MLTRMLAKSVFIEEYIHPYESWLRLLARKWEAPPWQGTRHAMGNVSNFLWLLCIPMDRGRRSEMRARLRGVRELTFAESKRGDVRDRRRIKIFNKNF